MSADRVWAKRMYEEFSAAPMSETTRSNFERMVGRGDCQGIVDLLETYIQRRPDVGRSIDRGGGVSFESREAVVRALHKAWTIDKASR